MKLKTIIYTGIILVVGTIGGMIGRYCTLDNDYRIKRADDLVVLYSTSLNKAYPLTKIDSQVYLGDSAHNLNGVRAIGIHEGKQSTQPQVDQLNGIITDLESQMNARKFTDRLENIADDIKDGWRNFKHNLLDYQQ